MTKTLRHKRKLSACAIVFAFASSNASAAFIVAGANISTPAGGAGILAIQSKSADSAQPGFTGSVTAVATVPADGGMAWATADLRSGTLRGYGNTVGSANSAGFGAALSEQFTFAIAGASSDTITRLFLDIDFEAATQGGTSVGYVNELRTNVATSFSNMVFSFNVFTHSTGNPIESFNRNLTYTSRGDSTASGSTRYLLPFDVRGASSSVLYSSEVKGFGDRFGITDFANSGHVRFVLPENVTVTSTSGFALAGAIPEPATWAMMIAGFFTVGAISRSRSRGSVSYT